MSRISERAEIADFGAKGHAHRAARLRGGGKAHGVHRLRKFCASYESRQVWRHLWQHLGVQEVARECPLVDISGYGSQIRARGLETIK